MCIKLQADMIVTRVFDDKIIRATNYVQMQLHIIIILSVTILQFYCRNVDNDIITNHGISK